MNACIAAFTRDLLFDKSRRALGRYRTAAEQVPQKVREVLNTMKAVHGFQTREEVWQCMDSVLGRQGQRQGPKNVIYVWVGDKLYVWGTIRGLFARSYGITMSAMLPQGLWPHSMLTTSYRPASL